MISIDPGTRFLGWARWDGRVLVAAGCSKADKGPHTSMAERHVWTIGRGRDSLGVMESMEYVRQRATTPQDLIDVQTVGCLVLASLAPIWFLIGPSEWKGTISKEIHHPRLLDVLDPAERRIAETAAYTAGSHAKEVLDALGVGLYYLRRVDRSGGPRT